jgi:DNA repair ATPase RecN
MPWWTWLALGVFGLAVAATAVFAVFAFQRLKSLGATANRIQGRLDEVAAAAATLEERLAHAQARSEEVERHARRLEASFERLTVLSSALTEARRGIVRLRDSYLKK